jgi:heme/copper-type cytochrome/quinol oxidase subunit 3
VHTAVIDVSRLPNLVSGSRAPVWWGIVMLLAIESAVFGTLIASYFYLRIGEPQWPPPGVDPPKLLLPTINTFILLASSVPMYLADTGVTRGRLTRLRWGLAGALVLAITFLALKVVEYSDVPYAWDDHAYGSIVWLVIGFHSAHVISLVLKTIVMLILAWRGYFNEKRTLGVQVNGLYWHFVVAVWVPLYVVLYWSPRWLE